MNKLPSSPTDDLIEALAEIEHQQWMHWSKTVAAEVSPVTRKKWQGSWTDYNKLTEAMKEADRLWARKVVTLLRQRRLVE